jgi:uncharacterized delta-60 repeat protein
MPTRFLISILSLGLLAGAVRGFAAAGDLDPTFDGDGKLSTKVSTNNFGFDSAKAVLAQPDGKILAVGESDSHIALVRYLTNGVLDTSFGAGGIVTTALAEDDYFYVTDAALQPDGKIVVVGQVYTATNSSYDVVVARYLTNGVLDASFGAGGLAIHDLGMDDIGEAIALQPDGRIVVAAHGYNFSPIQNLYAALRLLTNGALDTTFDGDGWAEASFSGSDFARPTAIALQSDGRIVLAGYSTVGGVNQIALARFQTNGVLDGGFGSGGVVATSLDTTNASAESVAIQTDGRIVVAGSASLNFDGWLLAARYQTNGSVDLGFGTNGLMLSAGAGATAVAMQPDGRILLAGYVDLDTALFRYDTNGSPDTSFGTGGLVQTGLGPAQDSAAALALQADGKIVVAGSAFFPVTSDGRFVLARFLSDATATPGPTLSITPAAAGQATLSWSPATPGYLLQETLTLSPAAWTNAPSGSTNPVVIPTAAWFRLYRLIKP